MDYKKIIKMISFLFSGLVVGALLILISELIKFSHLNLIPFGGVSWAVWFHPVAMGVSFGILSKLFKINKPIYIFLFVTIISIITFYFIYNGLLFINPLPFGINTSSAI
ncbi:MAG: hypothetical protein HYV53_01445 [Parcubacteria group bacterium]|nr:hypothetical protein [Parcubacteria group bacterium]